jgi:hypothetical protein
LVLFNCDQPADFSDIQPGMRAKVIGKLFSDGSNPAVIKAVAILLERQQITGQLVSVKESGSVGDYLLEIATTPDDATADTVSVFLPAGTPIEFVGDGSVDIELLEQLTACGTQPFVKVTATPSTNGSADLVAECVDVVPEKVFGTVQSVDSQTRIITIDTETQTGLTVGVQNGAFIFKCGKYYGPVPLDSIQTGDQLSAFGLTNCIDPDQTVDFLAFMVVIDKWDDNQ